MVDEIAQLKCTSTCRRGWQKILLFGLLTDGKIDLFVKFILSSIVVIDVRQKTQYYCDLMQGFRIPKVHANPLFILETKHKVNCENLYDLPVSMPFSDLWKAEKSGE